jgi:DNA-binding response OmpR family regulator
MAALSSSLPTPARVLLVVDQPPLARLLRLAVAHGPYTTELAPSVAAASAALPRWRPQLVLVDMALTSPTWWTALGQAVAGGGLPVIALTRRGDLATKLAAFDHGVDDILSVPFAPDELVARIGALLRRTYRVPLAVTPVLRLGELELDLLNRRVHVGGHELHLTTLELTLLYVLAANAGQVVRRDDLLDQVWGLDFLAESNVVDRHVRSLRAKLQNSWKQPRFIATVPGQGYRFVPTHPAPDPVATPPAPAP